MAPASPDNSEWRFPNRATPLGSPAYYAVRFSPPAQRERNALLIAWYDLIRGIADRPQDPGVARLKLDWWRDEILHLPGGASRHPLCLCLHAEGVGAAAVAPMRAIIDAAERMVRVPTPADDAAFAEVCRNTRGRFFVLLARLEPDADPDLPACVEAGAFCEAVERVRGLAARPDLLPPAVGALDATRRGNRLDALLDNFAHGAGDAGRALPDLARRLTALAAALHAKMRRSGYPVGNTPIDRAPIAHLWTAWRSRR